MKIGFIGLGIMGRGMARNLSLKKHSVTAWNRTKHRDLQRKLPRVKMAGTIREAVNGREIVVVSVTGPDAQDAVFHGGEGIFFSAKPGTLILDATTSRPVQTRALAKKAKDAGLIYVDAPVFGSREESWHGRLDIVWGGPAAAGRKALPVFKAIAKSVHHMGETGAGTAMKLIGNNIVAAEFMALAEGLALAAKSGVDLKAIPGVLEEADYGSGLLISNTRNALKKNFEPFFYLKHMLKDARLIGEFARDAGVPVYGNAVAVESLQGAVLQGFGEENVSALIKYVASLAGVKK